MPWGYGSPRIKLWLNLSNADTGCLAPAAALCPYEITLPFGVPPLLPSRTVMLLLALRFVCFNFYGKAIPARFPAGICEFHSSNALRASATMATGLCFIYAAILGL